MGRTFAAWFLVALAAGTPTASPRAVVQSAVARVIALVQESPDPDRTTRPDFVEKRRAEIRRIATDLFDFEEMSRRALGQHWAARSRVERGEFVALFAELLERSYVGRIESYAGERISYPAEILDGASATVRSRIVTKRRSEIALDYRMYLDDGRWKVYDISVDGVSFVATYRSEFNRVIRSSSYASLVERMRGKRFQIDVLG